MRNLILEAAEKTASNGSNGTMESIKKVFKSPVFYIVLGITLLLIVLIYLLRRFVKARANQVTIVIRKGKIYKVIDEKTPKYFLRPFIDKVGAVISLDEKEYTSDKLYINNGPDALYKINYTLKYKVTNPVEFYKYRDNIQKLIIQAINDDLREFADKGNALVIVADYRENNQKILDLIDEAIKDYSVKCTLLKINFIEPVSGK